MNLLAILFIAIALAMDAFAVSIASGGIIKKLHLRHAVRISLFFGIFQAVMPILGWLAGNGFRGLISSFDHWIAFCLLTFIGGKMIYESRSLDVDKRMDPLKFKILLILAIATSIDAFGVGLSLSMLEVTILIPALIIGIVTFILSMVGVYIGRKFGHFLEKKIEVIGGIILIIIAFEILLAHVL